MDNLAHALVGAALGRAIADRHVPRAALIGAIAANMPDWAELFMGYWEWTPADRLIQHRGITHSLLGAAIEIPILILLVGLIARGWSRRRGTGRVPPWGWLTICVAVTVLSHLYMDWQGSYGWRPFLPWSSHWYYLDWVAIVDPFFWLLPLVALAWGSERHWRPLSWIVLIGGFITLLLVWRRDLVASWVLVACGVISFVAIVGWIRYWFGPMARQRVATFALVLLVLYAGAQAVSGAARKREIKELAQHRFGKGAAWAALTNIGQPFTWEAIYADSDTVAGDDWRIARHLRDRAVVRVIHDTPEGQAIAQFARFLTAEVDTASHTVYLRDARYARVGRRGWAVTAIRTK
ncbi:MAG TPA: metal-dependent hydrolase [Gemmatimonadales bacterium]|nr:metal-dependent hydrolase [Gemmatimonadales bacterium]